MRPETQAHLFARLARGQVNGRLPSVAAGVVAGGRLGWTGGRGWTADGETDADTQYRIGSITKPLTAILVLRLRDEGLLRLDDPVGEHLPGFALATRTVGQLLAHASGLRAEPPGEWWERIDNPPWAEVEDGIEPADLLFNAGHRFHYSNVGYGALGEIVARKRDRPWIECLTDEVLRPLEMSRTTFDPQAPHARGYAVHPFADLLLDEPHTSLGGMAPAGQLWSTVADLARLVTFLLGDTAGVLSADTLAEMQQPGTVDDTRGPWSSYGYGVQVHRLDGRTVVGHGGSVPGFLAVVAAEPEEQAGVVVLANATAGMEADLATDLLAIVRDREPRVVAPWRPSPALSDDVVARLGTWYWGPMAFHLRLRPDGDLEIAPAGASGRGARFTDVGGRWIGRNGYYAGEELQFADDHLDIGTFVFTRSPYPVGDTVPGGVEHLWRGISDDD